MQIESQNVLAEVQSQITPAFVTAATVVGASDHRVDLPEKRLMLIPQSFDLLSRQIAKRSLTRLTAADSSCSK